MVERTNKGGGRKAPQAAPDENAQSPGTAAEDRSLRQEGGDPSGQGEFAPGARHRSATHEGRDQRLTEEQFDEDLDGGAGWSPPSALEAPPPRPGYVQRWIRAEQAGTPDTKNVSSKYREGWRPRDPSTVPDGYFPPTLGHGSFEGFIGVEGMVLCEMPVKLHKQRAQYYRDRVAKQEEAVSQDLFKETGGQVQSGSKSRVTRGRRPQPAAADDE
jgi:hypothetical protein